MHDIQILDILYVTALLDWRLFNMTNDKSVCLCILYVYVLSIININERNKFQWNNQEWYS